jgi:hypothetical protein
MRVYFVPMLLGIGGFLWRLLEPNELMIFDRALVVVKFKRSLPFTATAFVRLLHLAGNLNRHDSPTSLAFPCSFFHDWAHSRCF